MSLTRPAESFCAGSDEGSADFTILGWSALGEACLKGPAKYLSQTTCGFCVREIIL